MRIQVEPASRRGRGADVGVLGQARLITCVVCEGHDTRVMQHVIITDNPAECAVLKMSAQALTLCRSEACCCVTPHSVGRMEVAISCVRAPLLLNTEHASACALPEK